MLYAKVFFCYSLTELAVFEDAGLVIMGVFDLNKLSYYYIFDDWSYYCKITLFDESFFLPAIT